MGIKLSELKGLGPKSVAQLNAIGIHTREDLEAIGPVRAYLRLRESNTMTVSLNFLYAMVGALQDVHWSDIARTEKDRLLAELDGYVELEKLFRGASDHTP